MKESMLCCLEKTVGEECYVCQEIITEKDIEAIEDLQFNYPIEKYGNEDNEIEPICQDCYIAFFEIRSYKEDYNDLHPNETAEEFDDHEDHEPSSW